MCVCEGDAGGKQGLALSMYCLYVASLALLLQNPVQCPAWLPGFETGRRDLPFGVSSFFLWGRNSSVELSGPQQGTPSLF